MGKETQHAEDPDLLARACMLIQHRWSALLPSALRRPLVVGPAPVLSGAELGELGPRAQGPGYCLVRSEGTKCLFYLTTLQCDPELSRPARVPTSIALTPHHSLNNSHINTVTYNLLPKWLFWRMCFSRVATPPFLPKCLGCWDLEQMAPALSNLIYLEALGSVASRVQGWRCFAWEESSADDVKVRQPFFGGAF